MCGCGGGSARSSQQFEVRKPDGSVVVVASRAEALAIVRRDGGTWGPKS